MCVCVCVCTFHRGMLTFCRRVVFLNAALIHRGIDRDPHAFGLKGMTFGNTENS